MLKEETSLRRVYRRYTDSVWKQDFIDRMKAIIVKHIQKAYPDQEHETDELEDDLDEREVSVLGFEDDEDDNRVDDD